VSRHAATLDRRRRAGFVRQCHGDLHLRNVVLIDGAPVLFDGIEFNDDLACVDVLYDLAFLEMDLWGRGLLRHANAVWNAYLRESGDLDDLSVMPLFLACRAAVRVKTSATSAALQSGTAAGADAAERARQYLGLADDLLEPRPAQLIAMGGFSGSGKSTLALAIAPNIGAVPGAVVLRSDEIRKHLLGVSPLQHLDSSSYAPDVSARVYAILAERAARVIRGGHSVIADAVFGHEAERAAIEQVAHAAGVPFTGLWLEASPETLAERTARRTHDPSDADASVVRRQLAAGAGDIRWHRINTMRPADVVIRLGLRALQPGQVVTT
jgi:predicted kinase